MPFPVTINRSANLKRQDYSMIWEEHTLYLTPETAPQLLVSAGCASVALEVYPFAFEDVLVLYARKSGAGAMQAPLDRDAAGGPGQAAAILARFARRELDVLVGTQMVAKGHDFPGVTLVGVA